jgi:hypothetical protein
LLNANGAESARQTLFEAKTRRNKRQQGLLHTLKAEGLFSVQYLCIHSQLYYFFSCHLPVLILLGASFTLHCVSQPLTQKKPCSYSGPYHATSPDTQRRNLELKIAEDFEDRALIEK